MSRGQRMGLMIFGSRNIETSILSSRSGFTLLELIISFLMMGIIVVIILGAMRLGTRAVDAGEKRIYALERSRTSMNIMNSQIHSLFPLSYVDNGEKKSYFQGDKEYMQFPSNYSIWGGQKGYVLVKYKVESDGSGKYVLSASESVIGTDKSNEVKLFNPFDSMYFEYFYKDPTEENGKWVDKLPDDVPLPLKIKVHLIYGTKDFFMIIPVRTANSQIQPSTIVTPSQ